MSEIRVLRAVARWLSALMLAGVLCPRVPVRAETAPAEAAARGSVVVLDSAPKHIVLSMGSKDHVTPGTQFRVTRGGEELARVKVTVVDFATCHAVVVSGKPASQIRPNDRAEMVGQPAPRPRGGFKFPWGVLVGAGVVALVIMGIDRGPGKDATSTSTDGGNNNTTTGGSATVSIN